MLPSDSKASKQETTAGDHDDRLEDHAERSKKAAVKQKKGSPSVRWLLILVLVRTAAHRPLVQWGGGGFPPPCSTPVAPYVQY